MPGVFSDEDCTFNSLLEYLINGSLQDMYFVLKGFASLDERIDIFHGIHKTHKLRISVQLTFHSLETFIRRNNCNMTTKVTRT